MNSSLFLSGISKYNGLSINTDKSSLLILYVSIREVLLALMPISGFEIFKVWQNRICYLSYLRSYSTDWIKDTRKDFKKISGDILIFGGKSDDFLPMYVIGHILSINYS